MCDPNDSFVNSTESEICGIPKTIKPPTNTTSSENTMSESIAPSAVSPPFPP